jgi:hypothetical protein
MPKVAIDEDGEPSSSERKIRCAENLPVIPSEAQADRFQRQSQPFFRLRFGCSHRPHNAAACFLVEHVGHKS